MRLLMAVLVLHLLGVPAAAQVDVDYAELPASTESELFSRAVVVMRGRVEARTIESTPGPTTSVYSLRILELLKGGGHYSVGEVVDVHRHGGLEARTADRAFPPFDVNDEVVLFLERGRNGWYWPLNGPDGAFRLNADGRTFAYGRMGAVSKRHAGRPVTEFMAELRTQKN
jgi:hypothetical protein